MVETTLLKEPLTPEMIDIGSRLTTELDRMGLPIIASFWLFDSESNDWLLRIASPVNDSQGSRVVYEKVAAARSSIGLSQPEFPLRHVSVIASGDDLVRALQEEFKDHRIDPPRRLGRCAIRGSFVDDAYIYRVN